MASVRTLKVGFSHCFCRRAPFLWCTESRWSPPLGPSVALKISKNGFKAKKLWPPNKGACFYQKFSIEQLITYLGTLQKSLNLTLLPLELQHDL
jgi:hypothetical protein